MYSYASNILSNLSGVESISKLFIYSIMNSPPCSDPGNPAVISFSIANLKHENVAGKL